MQIIQKSLVLLLIFIPVVSCSSSPNSSGATNKNISLSTAPSLKSVSAPTKTKLPSIKPTTYPLTETNTVTASPDPTWTALPTLSRIEAGEYVAHLMETNAGCTLPCWWGILPGETSWQSAYHFFRAFTTDIKNNGDSVVEFTDSFTSSDYYVYYEISGVEGDGGARISIEDGMVKEILTGPYSTMENVQLNQILSAYGEPEEVFINTHPKPGPFGHPLSLVLLYADQRIMLDYEIEASLAGDLVRACPEITGPWLWIRSEGDPWTDISIEETILGPDARGELLPIDEATDYDINTFTKIFIDQNSCIESQSSVWEDF